MPRKKTTRPDAASAASPLPAEKPATRRTPRVPAEVVVDAALERSAPTSRGGAGNWNTRNAIPVMKVDAAKMTGISTTTWVNWQNQGMPVEDDGKVNLGLAIKWLCDRAEAKGAEDSAKMVKALVGDEELTVEKIELYSALADLQIKELKFKAANNEVIPKALVYDMVNDQVGEVVSRFRGLGSKIGPLVAAESNTKKCIQITDRAVDEAYERIAADDGTGTIDPDKLLFPKDAMPPEAVLGLDSNVPKKRATKRKAEKVVEPEA